MKQINTLNRAKYAASAAPVALGMALAFMPSAAFAQDQAEGVSGTPSDATSEPIVVTGTRVSRPDLESVSPVTVVGAQDIADTGTTRTEDLLNALPQVFAAQNAFVVNGGTGTATVDLRGLGAIRTLVLIDGRRLQPGDPFAVTADINQIPSSLIERVDIVTGGASAVYGADAVSGVVNFIMDRDFEGVRADAQVSFYQHDNNNETIQDLLTSQFRDLGRLGFPVPNGTPVDGFGYDANVVFGAGFDDGRGHVTAYLGYRQIDALKQDARDYSACGLDSFAGGPVGTPSGYNCSGSGTTPVGSFYFYNGDNPTPGFSDFTALTLDENTGGFRRRLASDSYNFNPANFFQRPDKRYTAGFFADYEISESVQPYAEFMFMDDNSDAQIAASGSFFANTFGNPDLFGNYGSGTFSCAHPLLNDLQRTQLGCTGPDNEFLYFYTGKRLVEAGPRVAQIRHTSHREVLGVRGNISPEWTYDAYLQRGETIFSQSYVNDVSVRRLNQALDAVVDGSGNIVCRDTSGGCIPLNIFEIGGVTPEQADFITVPGLLDSSLEQYIASGYVTGPLGTLWANDPVSIVLGAEYRKEQYDLRPDEAFETGDLAGQGGPTAAVNGEFAVREVFAELVAPLVDFGNGGGIDLQAGYRLSDYTTTGTSHTYKAGLEIAPFEGIRFRGIYNRAERSPNVVELFAPAQIGLFGGTDPCAGATPTATLAQCINTGVTPAQYGNIGANPANQYNQQGGGNLNLQPEKADTYTVGAVIDGGGFGIPGLTATVDYFYIDIGDAIQGYGAQFTLDQCIATGDPFFCGNINRGNNGTLYLGQSGFVINQQQNIGGVRTSGIDFSAGYRLPLGPGSLFANIVGTYLIDYQFQNEPSSNFYDCAGYFGATCGQPNPEYRHRVSLGYTADSGWSLTGRWRHYGGVDLDQTSSDPLLSGGQTGTVDDSIESFNWFDLSGSYDFTDNFRLTAGVNNVFDIDPPTIGGDFAPTNANTYPGQYDPVGRYVFLRGQLQF